MLSKKCRHQRNFYNAGEKKTVTLSYAGQNVEVVFSDVTFTNDRQKADVSVVKKDKDTENPLSGGVFAMYAGSDITDADGTVVVKKGTLIEKATTGADGKAITASKNFHVHSKEGSGSVDVTFNWDSSDFEGTAVITQTMYLVNDDKSETKVAEATDLSDANEMVYYPSIRTNAADSQNKRTM